MHFKKFCINRTIRIIIWIWIGKQSAKSGTLLQSAKSGTLLQSAKSGTLLQWVQTGRFNSFRLPLRHVV